MPSAVATREGGVDRNSLRMLCAKPTGVATREGGVDRNINQTEKDIDELVVATREGGVDRNTKYLLFVPCGSLSPPARVAWIEI